MRPARARVVGRFDKATTQTATVTLDRNANVFSVRIYKRKRTFELPLATVAEIVVDRIIKAEVVAKREAKRAKRRGIR